jgi:hypothetical protein
MKVYFLGVLNILIWIIIKLLKIGLGQKLYISYLEKEGVAATIFGSSLLSNRCWTSARSRKSYLS